MIIRMIASVGIFVSLCYPLTTLINSEIERLQYISAQDIKSEGVSYTIDYYPNLIDIWQDLWVKINGQDSWDENPFVWVISFKKIDRPNGFY